MVFLAGEWWNRDPMVVLRQSLITGAAPNVSDAYLINGQPGDLYICSSRGLVLIFLPITVYVCSINLKYDAKLMSNNIMKHGS